jgi:hypothetical protein
MEGGICEILNELLLLESGLGVCTLASSWK